MADKIRLQAAKELRQKTMLLEYETWHSKADCTGLVPKKTEAAKVGDAKTAAPNASASEEDGDVEKLYKQQETGVMRLLVVS